MNAFLTCPNCHRVIDVPGLCHQCRHETAWAKRMSVLCAVVLVILLCGWATNCKGSVVTEDFVSWVEQRESGGNPKARGKAGELGCMQLKAIAVREVNRIFGTCYQHRDALDPVKARVIGALYLRLCETRCAVKTREAVYRRYRGLR